MSIHVLRLLLLQVPWQLQRTEFAEIEINTLITENATDAAEKALILLPDPESPPEDGDSAARYVIAAGAINLIPVEAADGDPIVGTNSKKKATKRSSLSNDAASGGGSGKKLTSKGLPTRPPSVAAKSRFPETTTSRYLTTKGTNTKKSVLTASVSSKHVGLPAARKIDELQRLHFKVIDISRLLGLVGVAILAGTVFAILVVLRMQYQGPIWFTVIILGPQQMALLADILILLIMAKSFRLDIE